jgi:hypothetical protein
MASSRTSSTAEFLQTFGQFPGRRSLTPQAPSGEVPDRRGKSTLLDEFPQDDAHRVDVELGDGFQDTALRP